MAPGTVWKWPLADNHREVQVLRMPVGASVLSFGFLSEGRGRRADVPVLWALVDPTQARLENRRVRLLFTGDPGVDLDGWRYVATAVDYADEVWHLFADTISGG